MNLVRFLSLVSSREFLGDYELQNQMTEFAIKSMDAEILMILCHLDELHANTFFPSNTLSKELKSQASVDQLITALTTLNAIPVAEYMEEVFVRGTSEQILKMEAIRQQWIINGTINEQ